MGANPKQGIRIYCFFLLAFVLIARWYGHERQPGLLIFDRDRPIGPFRHDLPESEAAGARRELTNRRLSYRADKKERALCYLPEFS